MNRESWQSIKDHFAAASALTGAERVAYLDANCGDPTLRAELESLLAAHAQVDAVVDQPAVAYINGATLSGSPEQRIGMRLGPYEIVALIGRGGMGDVYRARRVDAQYEKEVAIKLVPGGYQASFVLERLRAERQILANLEHPNIARLLDGGASQDGTPYLVMELVEGQPLDRYCAGRPLEARLDLFRDVCAAVSYAHQRLVIHRDLKPGNVLVTADGTVKLLDFGIAKLVQPSPADDQAAATLIQPLTPGFASPEQVLGKTITTASDVYSLGVVLYQLLAGRSPYRNQIKTTQDAIREICEVVPPPPSAAANAAIRRIPHDLDAIVMRALRKEPERRYTSVAELSEDLLRYLKRLPVHARGDEFSYRAGKFLRRHKLQVGAAALVFISLLGGIFFSLREARIAERHRQAAEAQRARAERHFQSVRKLANTMMFEIHDAILALPGSTQARQLIAARAKEYLESLTLDTQSDPALLAEIATAYRQLATVQGNPYNANLGDRQGALESHRRAIALLEQALQMQPGNADFQRELALNYTRMAMLGGVVDRKAEGEFLQKAIGILERASAASPADTQVSRNLATAYAQYAQHLRNGHEFAPATGFYRKVLSVYEHLHGAHPEEPMFQQNLSHAHRYLGTILALQKQFPAALEQYRIAETLNADRLAHDPDNQEARFNVTLSDSNIGFVLGELGDVDGALGYYRKVLAARSALVKADPRDERALTGLSETFNYLGVNLARKGDYLNALDAFNKSLSLRKDLAKNNPADNTHLYELAWTGANIGQTHAALARDSHATRNQRIDHCNQAREWIEKALPKWIEGQSEIKLGVGGAEELAGLRRDVADCNRLLGRTST